MSDFEHNPIPPPPAGRGRNRRDWFERTFPVGTPIIFRQHEALQVGKWRIPAGVKGEIVELAPYELRIRLFPPVPGDPRFQVIEEQLAQPEGRGMRLEDLDIYVSIDGAVNGIIEPLVDTWGDAPKASRRHHLPRSQRARLKPNQEDGERWFGRCKRCGRSCFEDRPGFYVHGDPTIDADHKCVPDREDDRAPAVMRPNKRARPLKGAAMRTSFGNTREDIDDIGGKRGRQLDAAMDRYETFHDKAPIRVAELDHDLPKSWVCVGEALAVMYRTDKWKKDGTDIDYKHLHDKGEDKPYEFGKGVKFYEPASEVRKSKVNGRRTSRSPKKRAQRLPTGRPEALTLLGYCLGVFVQRYDDETIYEVNPRGCYLFSSPSGNMLAVYSPDEQPDGSSGFLAAMAGGNLRVLKDGIDG